MKTISFLNMKGGVGKTTSSLNVATGLAMKGYKTLLIDFDPQANSTSIFINDLPELAINHLIFNPTLTSNAIVSVDENLDLIPSSLDLAMSEMELCLQKKLPQHNRLLKILAEVKNYEYVIIDCPPIINTLTINAILASDEIIVPIKPDKFAVSGFGITMKNVMEIKENFDCNPKIKVLFTIVSRNNTEKEVINQLSSATDTYESRIRNQPKPIAEASLENRVVIKDVKIPVAQDYIALVNEMIGGAE